MVLPVAVVAEDDAVLVGVLLADFAARRLEEARELTLRLLAREIAAGELEADIYRVAESNQYPFSRFFILSMTLLRTYVAAALGAELLGSTAVEVERKSAAISSLLHIKCQSTS